MLCRSASRPGARSDRSGCSLQTCADSFLFSLPFNSLFAGLLPFFQWLIAFDIRYFACVLVLRAVLYRLIALALAVLSVALRFPQLFAIGGGYGDDFIAFAQVHEAHTLRGASGDVDGADIRADDHAAGRDNHQVVICFG